MGTAAINRRTSYARHRLRDIRARSRIRVEDHCGRQTVADGLVGKVLALDKVLEVAREAGEKRFAGDIAWAEAYARAVLATLNRDAVRVDVSESTVA
jgi:hypothetical protein